MLEKEAVMAEHCKANAENRVVTQRQSHRELGELELDGQEGIVEVEQPPWLPWDPKLLLLRLPAISLTQFLVATFFPVAFCMNFSPKCLTYKLPTAIFC